MSGMEKVPHLADWITPGKAAAVLEVSKQAVHNLMKAGKITSLHQVGTVGDRPFYVMREGEVVRMAAEREEDKNSNETHLT